MGNRKKRLLKWSVPISALIVLVLKSSLGLDIPEESILATMEVIIEIGLAIAVATGFIMDPKE